jgi:peptide deformylase
MLTIVRYGDPVLRRRCKPVKRVDREIRHLMEEMLETMAAEDGLGLAAPQVGIPLRMIVCALDDEEYCLANPRVVRKSKETVSDMEGCLSLPRLYGEVIRPASVKVSGLNLHGQTVEIEAEGLLAKAFSHEIDHLSGVLFIDKILPDTLHWLVRVPSEVPGEPDQYVREATSLEAAIQRLLARKWPGVEKETLTAVSSHTL